MGKKTAGMFGVWWLFFFNLAQTMLLKSHF